MNRLVTTTPHRVSPSELPPELHEGKLRVLFLHSMILGIATYSRQLEAFIAARDDVDAVHVEIPIPLWARVIGKSIRWLPRGWDFHAYRYLLLYRIIIGRWIRKHLDPSRFDVIHFGTQLMSGVIPRLVRESIRDGRPRPLLSLHLDATYVSSIRDLGFSPLARRPLITNERAIFRNADLLTPWSEWVACSLREDYGVAASKILICPGSLTLPAASPARPPKGLVRIVFAGHAWERKGGPLLLKLHQERFADRAELHICSGGVRPVRSARNVVWHGSVPRQRLIDELLPSMDLFAMPTKDDTFLWAALEAGAAGLPCVVCRVAGVPEVVLDGVTGLLVERRDDEAFASALEKLIEDAEVRHTMGAAAQAHVRAGFDPAINYGRLVDRWWELFRQRSS